MKITVSLSPQEAYALRDFVVRANDREIETILGERGSHARYAGEARYKLSTAIWSDLGAPCGDCGAPESDHEANYYCPEYRAPKHLKVDPEPFGKLNVPNPDFLHEELASYEASLKPKE